MSNLVVSNISDGTTSVGTGYVVNGAAKAWVNMNGTGTIAIRDSLNVGSITDNGTGVYSVSLTNSFGAVNYATGLGCDNQPGVTSFVSMATDDRAVGSIMLITTQFASNIFFDCENVDCSFHGDLA